MPRYSVIIPTYNRAPFLKKALESVLNQTFEDFELIIFDDGSTDGTSDLIKSYNDIRIKYIYQENTGVSRARNRALSHAMGEYIAFLDSDDWWLKRKLEEAEEAIRQNPSYKIYHTQEKWFRNGEHLNHMKKHLKKGGYIFENCLELCSVSISTAVIKKILFDEIGNFDENMEVCEDYDFWIRATSKYPVCLIDKVLTEKEGGHPDQLSSRYWGMDRFRIQAIRKLLESGLLDEEKASLAYNKLRKKCEIYAQGCFKREKHEEGKKYIKLIEDFSHLSSNI
jgi:glycosyltransferase involved in cell wall biosynthesis